MNISNYHLTNFEFINCNFLIVNVEVSEKGWSYSEAKTFEFGRGLLDIIYAKKPSLFLRKEINLALTSSFWLSFLKCHIWF